MKSKFLLLILLLAFASVVSAYDTKENAFCFAYEDGRWTGYYGTVGISHGCNLITGEQERGTLTGECCGFIEEKEPYYYSQDGMARSSNQYITAICYNSNLNKSCCSAEDKSILCNTDVQCAKEYYNSVDGNEIYQKAECCPEGESLCSSSWTDEEGQVHHKDVCYNPKEKVCVSERERYSLQICPKWVSSNPQPYKDFRNKYSGPLLSYSDTPMMIGNVLEGCFVEKNNGRMDLYNCSCNGEDILGSCVGEGVNLPSGLSAEEKREKLSGGIGCCNGELKNLSKELCCGDSCGVVSGKVNESCCCDLNGDSRMQETCERKVCKGFKKEMNVSVDGENYLLKLVQQKETVFTYEFYDETTKIRIIATYNNATNSTYLSYSLNNNYFGVDYYSASYPCGHMEAGDEIVLKNYNGDKKNLKVEEAPCCPESDSISAKFSAVIDLRDEMGDLDENKLKIDGPMPSQKVLFEDEDLKVETELSSPNMPLCQDNEKCGIPSSFSIQIKVRARYYDDTLVVWNKNIDEIVIQAMENVEKVVGPIDVFALEAGESEKLFFDNDYYKYFIAHNFDVPNFFGQGLASGDDGIWITRTVKMNFELKDDSVILSSVSDAIEGEPVHPENYNKFYNKGSVLKKEVIENSNIVLTKGDLSEQIYKGFFLGVISEMINTQESSTFNSRGYKSIFTRVVRDKDDGRLYYEPTGSLVQGISYIVPKVLVNETDKLKKFKGTIESCCGKKPISMPASIVNICPDSEEKLVAQGYRSADLTPQEHPSYLQYSNDYILESSLELRNIKYYSSKDSIKAGLSSKSDCGVPTTIVSKVKLFGRYYDQTSWFGAVDDSDVFSGARAEVVKNFPPKVVLNWFADAGKKEVIYDTDFIRQTLLDLDSAGTTDDSKRVTEEIIMVMSRKGNEVRINVFDIINVAPEASGGRVSSPLVPKSTEVVLTQNSKLFADLLFSGFSDAMVKGYYTSLREPKFTSTFDVRESKGILINETAVVSKADEQLVKYISQKGQCCIVDSVLEEGKRKQKSKGTSVYIFRNDSNFSLGGEGYLISLSEEYSGDISKGFVVDSDTQNYSIYRFEDDELDYEILDSEVYGAEVGEYYSSDDKFAVELFENISGSLTISKVSVAEPEITIKEIENTPISLEEFLESANEYVYENGDAVDYYTNLGNWFAG